MAESINTHTNSINRRGFLSATISAGALSAGAFPAHAGPEPPKGDFRLGSVTYNLLKDYDLETVIKTLEAVEFEAVELRTTHKHGVEPSINAAERTRVAAALLKGAGHQNVGACWNCNPTDVQNGSVKESFALLGKYIRNVHIHELSDTKYPFRELFSLLQQAGYDRYTLAEVAESK